MLSAGDGRKRGAAISLSSEAAHLFPGIGLPAPTHPQSGNSLALGLWEKGTTWLPASPGGMGRGCRCCNPFQASHPHSSSCLLPTVLGTGRVAGPRWHCPSSTSSQAQSNRTLFSSPPLAWLASWLPASLLVPAWEVR